MKTKAALNGARADIDDCYARTRAGGSSVVVQQLSEAMSGTAGPSGSVNFTSTGTITVGASGKVNLTAQMTVAAGAGTGAAGDEIHFEPQIGLVSVPGYDAFGELSVTHKNAICTVVATKSGLAPGSTVHVGVSATDQNGVNTIVAQAASFNATSF